jgi:hypothetical protein
LLIATEIFAARDIKSLAIGPLVQSIEAEHSKIETGKLCPAGNV